jgi:tetratricopeptide (TPR) repeat protein
MHRHAAVVVLVTALSAVIAPPLRSQTTLLLDLPLESQSAQVTQKIGITNISITYHRPRAKGRKIWGWLEPYGSVWRAGANENTVFEVSDPVTVEGRELPKGIYGLHMIPGESEWIVIFSKRSNSWGSFSYDPAEDALRIAVKPQKTDMHDALTYDFDDPMPDAVTVTMRWEKLAVPFKIAVDTNEIVQASLRDQQLHSRLQYFWSSWNDAGAYLLDHNLSPQDALRYADKSIQIEERFDNLITKARALDRLNRRDEATTVRNKALAMANVMQVNSYGRQLQVEGKQDEAFEVFRDNIKRNPNHWVAHYETARMASAQGDFDGAVKEMKLALGGAPDSQRSPIENLIKRLEAREDINK